MVDQQETLGIEERRLWIGNLDLRLTDIKYFNFYSYWYQLLKIVQQCGKIDKFDMLFHKGGPQAGQPRGYAFVTFKSVEESYKAFEKLNGKLIGSKKIAVRLAKNINYDELERPKPKIEIPVLAAGGSKSSKISKEAAIQAIEAKLKNLERNKNDDFEINQSKGNITPLIQKFQFNKKYGESSQSNRNSSLRNHKKKHKNEKPYTKRY